MLKKIYYSFPVQLLLFHLRRTLFLVLPFLLLDFTITQHFAVKYGIPYLFLDPEYQGNVGFLSFFMVGFLFGLFVLIWNFTSYILHSKRFGFIATFKRPFLRYCLNNSIIPLSTLIIYFICIYYFQAYYEYRTFIQIILRYLSFLTGTIVVLMIMFYPRLNFTRDDLEAEINKRTRKRRRFIRAWRFNIEGDPSRPDDIRVDYVFLSPWDIRRVRPVHHYEDEALEYVFNKHHKTALLIELITIGILIASSLLMDQQWARIPAAGSILLFFSILIAPAGALTYWLKKWAFTGFIILFIVMNIIIKFDFLAFENKAYGMNYNAKPVPYTLDQIESTSSNNANLADQQLTLQMLTNWQKKLNPTNDPLKKPKLILMNTSGGGLRSTVWTFFMLQILDAQTHHQFMRHTTLISGASGGMLGAGYFRELYLRHENGQHINLQNPKYLENISKDLLNAVSFAIVSNDIFLPFQKFSMDSFSYRKDRGYLFEKQLNENTFGIMKKPISDYAQPELNAEIPMMIFTPTLIADGRKLNVASFPVSYLDAPPEKFNSNDFYLTDGVDFQRFFRNQNARGLQFTTAIRMNATFPYIMPNVFLPSEPNVQVMDAGLRENYGFETSQRFLQVFSNWIEANTSGVIIVQFRDYKKDDDPDVEKHLSLSDKLTDPISSIYKNWSSFQDYEDDNAANNIDKLLNVPVTFVSFEYTPSEKNREASMSWHLTSREKEDVINSANDSHNQNEMKKLLSVLLNQ
jgi:hypothetical protein